MHKILLSFFIAISISQVNAQCTPDGSATGDGIHPTQVEGLATGYETVPYSQTLTVIIPSDTTIDVFGTPTTVPIDDATVTNVAGLPAGFSYACDVSGCVFPGGETHCAVLTGTPTLGQAGSYPLEIYVTYHAGFISADDTVTGYTLNINTVGIWEINKNNTLKINANPNPFTQNTTIDFIAPKSGNVVITIYNTLGKAVMTETKKVIVGENTYQLLGSNLVEGVYLVELFDGKNKTTQRLIKQ